MTSHTVLDRPATVPDDAHSRAWTACLDAAVAAPSVHNTQPWQFRVGRGRVDVLADYDRLLPVADPDGRELLISVGAAVLNLRLAILHAGRAPILRLLSSHRQGDAVARLTLGPPVAPGRTARALMTAVPRRHTSRLPFSDITVPARVLAELSAAAATEGATLSVPYEAERDSVLGLLRVANARQLADPAYRAEVGAWTLPVPQRRDGVPTQSFGVRAEPDTVPLRDFALVHPRTRNRPLRFETHPQLVVLSSTGDTPQDWLRTGQALERVWLTATYRGVAVTPMTQPVELPELRRVLSRGTGDGVAQVVLRLGYGRPSAGSPRRALTDVLVP
jgi:nitroreductase